MEAIIEGKNEAFYKKGKTLETYYHTDDTCRIFKVFQKVFGQIHR